MSSVGNDKVWNLYRCFMISIENQRSAIPNLQQSAIPRILKQIRYSNFVITKFSHGYGFFLLTILNDWEICNFAFCVWVCYYYIENRAVWVVFSCLNVVRAHLLSVLMAIIFLSRLRLRRAITSGSTPFMENDLANVSLYAMPLSLGQFWSFKNIVNGF